MNIDNLKRIIDALGEEDAWEDLGKMIGSKRQDYGHQLKVYNFVNYYVETLMSLLLRELGVSEQDQYRLVTDFEGTHPDVITDDDMNDERVKKLIALMRVAEALVRKK